MRIDELPISDYLIRILNHKLKLYTVDELIEVRDEDLFATPGIGKSQLRYIKRSIAWYQALNSNNDNTIKSTIQIELLFKNYFDNIKHEINEIRTIILEQYRLIQSMQIENRPDGIIKMINEKIPGFSSTIYDIYKKIEEK